MKFRVAFHFEDPHSVRRDYSGYWETEASSEDTARAEFRRDHSESFVIEFISPVEQ